MVKYTEGVRTVNKLIINTVKINSVNSQTLPLKEFKEGIIGNICVERPGVDYGVFRI